MRIGLIASEFPPGPGGIGVHAHNLAEQLITHHHQVVVFTAARPGYPSVEFDSQQSAKIIRFSAGVNSITRLVHLLTHIWKIRGSVDWVVLSGLSSLMVFPVAKWMLKAQFLCIVHGHEILMAKRGMRLLVRRALLRADRVVTVSEFAKAILLTNGISRPVITVPNGVSAPKGMSVRTPNANKLVLITVGSVTRRKGQHNVLSALPQIMKKFGVVEYHMVGVPVEKDRIQTLAHELGVTDRVVMHGAVSSDERDALLQQSDIFMMLSENLPDGDVEGFGIAVLEANGFGLPAIGSKDTGVEQAIDHGGSGYLVDAKNPEQICCAIDDILNHYSKFSTRAIAWAQQHDWCRIGKVYLDILEKN